MRISVFGLGYVGSVSACCFAQLGHTVIGIDANGDKAKGISNGGDTLIEPDLEKLVKDGVCSGKLKTTEDPVEAVHDTEVTMICVGTPSQNDGDMDSSSLTTVAREIGTALKAKGTHHTIIARSTMLPGTSRHKFIPAIEHHSGKLNGRHFEYYVHPEFLREGSAIADFHRPPKVVFGGPAAKANKLIAELYGKPAAPTFTTNIDTAEFIKYADNAWHALKVTYANEIGSICKRLGVDSLDLMRLFCSDTLLNISPAYLQPGFAFGGSCLPKDLRALAWLALKLDLKIPLIDSVLKSNELHIDRAFDLIIATGRQRIGLLGIAYKDGTDDVRESPFIKLVERLVSKGVALKVFDANVHLSAVNGANREHLLKTVPYIASLLVGSVEQLIAECDVVVVGNDSPIHRRAVQMLSKTHTIIDLAGLPEYPECCDYQGICW